MIDAWALERLVSSIAILVDRTFEGCMIRQVVGEGEQVQRALQQSG